MLGAIRSSRGKKLYLPLGIRSQKTEGGIWPYLIDSTGTSMKIDRTSRTIIPNPTGHPKCPERDGPRIGVLQSNATGASICNLPLISA
jgi:hypothetical protein